MKIKILIFLTLIIAAIGFEIWDNSHLPTAGAGVQPQSQKKGKTNNNDSPRILTPEFSFKDINSKEHKITDFKGKIILLNFWATWCAPCIAEFPQLVNLAQKNGDSLVLLAMSVDERPERIIPFLKKFDTDIQDKINKSDNIIIGIDKNKTISQNLFATVMYPETFIIAPDLSIKRKVTGIIEWNGKEVNSLLQELKNGKQIKVKQTSK